MHVAPLASPEKDPPYRCTHCVVDRLQVELQTSAAKEAWCKKIIKKLKDDLESSEKNAATTLFDRMKANEKLKHELSTTKAAARRKETDLMRTIDLLKESCAASKNDLLVLKEARANEEAAMENTFKRVKDLELKVEEIESIGKSALEKVTQSNLEKILALQAKDAALLCEMKPITKTAAPFAYKLERKRRAKSSKSY